MSKTENKTARKPYIICTGEHGRCVSFGYTESEPVMGETIIAEDSRLILRWAAGSNDSGTGLHRLATHGPIEDDRISPAVPRVGVGVVAQWLEVTPEAAERWLAL